MHCPSCGAPIFVGSKFCAMCGVRLDEIVEVDESDEASLPPVAPVSDASSGESEAGASDAGTVGDVGDQAGSVDAVEPDSSSGQEGDPYSTPASDSFPESASESASSQAPSPPPPPVPPSPPAPPVPPPPPPPPISSNLLVSPAYGSGGAGAPSTPPPAYDPATAPPYTGPTIAQMLETPKSMKVLGVLSLIIAPIYILINLALTGAGIAEFSRRTGGEAIVVTMAIFMAANIFLFLLLFIAGIGLVSGKTWGRKWALLFSWLMYPLFIILVITMGAGMGIAIANGLRANKGIEKIWFSVGPGPPLLVFTVIILAMFQVGKVQKWAYLKRQKQEGVDLNTLDPANLKVPNLSLAALFSYIFIYLPACFGPLVSFILSIVALNKISKAKGLLKGKGLAITALIISILQFLAIGGAIVTYAVVVNQKTPGARAEIVEDELRQIIQAQAILQNDDADRNGVPDFWIADLYSFSEFLPELIKPELLRADQSPYPQLTPPSRVPYKNYWFSVLVYDEQGKEYATDPDGDGKFTTNRYKWAICAYPADGEGLVFVVDESGTIYQADSFDVKTPVQEYPNTDSGPWRVVE